MEVDPETYENNNYIPRNDSKILLEAIANDFKSKTVDCVIDGGCGTGNVTMDIFNISKCKKLIAFDIGAAQIEYAKRRYENGAIKFKIGDIGDDWSKLKSDIDFDYEADIVVSNHCFFLVEDKRKALENIFKMLKPGGKCYIISLQDYKINYEDFVIHLPKWKQYFQPAFDLKAKQTESNGIKQCRKIAIAPFGIYYRQDEKDWRTMCESIGFQNIRLSVSNSSFSMWFDQVRDMFTYMCQWHRYIPDSMKSEFLQDYWNVYRKAWGEWCNVSVDNIVLIAEKPN